MAKITPGPLAGLISGKVGNVVFSRGRYGPYIRSRAIPTLVQNDYTADVRNRLIALTAAYSLLTAGEKASWKVYAEAFPRTDSLGRRMPLQPSAEFISLNARILQCGGTQINVPPIGGPPTDPGAITVVAAAGTPSVVVTFASYPFGANRPAAIRVAVLDIGFHGYYKNRLKLVAFKTIPAGLTADVTTEVVARFGTLQAGQQLSVEVEVWNRLTGLKSSRVVCQTLVTA